MNVKYYYRRRNEAVELITQWKIKELTKSETAVCRLGDQLTIYDPEKNHILSFVYLKNLHLHLYARID